jgi:hypothetical protein
VAFSAGPPREARGPHGFPGAGAHQKRGGGGELRLSKSAEISPTEAGYYVRKEIVAPRSLDRAVLEIWFDRRYRPVRKEVQGGELVPIREWA